MDEKILIKSEQYNVKKLFKIMLLIGLVVSIVCLVILTLSCISDADSHYNYLSRVHTSHSKIGYVDERCTLCMLPEFADSKISYILDDVIWYVFGSIFMLIWLLPTPVFALIGGIICPLFSGFELTVTDKRILGSIRKKRVDLPLDSVSAVSIGAFKSISVATSSGRISFSAIKNRNEIHKIISDLLVERQNQAPKSAATVVNAPATSNADELKKFKELLDAGIITQEEFDAKKKQLLGL